MPDRPIYMDCNATTPCDPQVFEAMMPWFSDRFGNPSSHLHVHGLEAREAVDRSREQLASHLGARAREVVFLGGATEANNLALLGLFGEQPCGSVVSQLTEHRSVLEPLRRLEQAGVTVIFAPTDADGRVEPEHVLEGLREDTRLVSIMAANNEIGTIQPLSRIGELCRERGIPFHVDAAQGFGRMPIDVGELGIDLLTLSAHKLYGPKGVGALLRREGLPPLTPRIWGGGQEGGLRSGTLNVPGIVGFARAAELALAGMHEENARLIALRARLLAGLQDRLPGLTVNGHPEERLAGNLNVTIDGVDGDALLVALREVSLSSGSACDSTEDEPSHVLRAIGLSETEVRNSIRFGLGRFNTQDEVDRVVEMVATKVSKLRGLSGRLPRSRRGN